MFSRFASFPLIAFVSLTTPAHASAQTEAPVPAATQPAPATSPTTPAVPAKPEVKFVKPPVVTGPRPSPKCPADSTVLVELRGVPLLVPRVNAYRLTLDDGISHFMLGRPGKDYDCSTPVIKNVRGIATTSYTLGIIGGKNTSEKRFAATRAAMLTAPKLRGSITQTLPSGIVKVVAPLVGSELFQLPIATAPTYDQVPVIFDCDVSETGDLGKLVPHYCHVAYLHPSGLPFTYNVLRSDYPRDDFVAADKEKRKAVDEMVAAGKAKKDLENKDQ